MNESFLAAGLTLKDRRIVFAGAGGVAERKLMRVVNTGARITVIAPHASAEIGRLASSGRIVLERRNAEPADFEATFLAFVATNDRDTNASLTAAARDRGALVNRADAPEDCDFVLPALAFMSPVHIGVFSGSPSLSKWVRRHLERTLGPEFPEFASVFAEIRRQVRKHNLPQAIRAEILTQLLNEGLYDVYRTSGMKKAMQRAEDLAKEYEGLRVEVTADEDPEED